MYERKAIEAILADFGIELDTAMKARLDINLRWALAFMIPLTVLGIEFSGVLTTGAPPSMPHLANYIFCAAASLGGLIASDYAAIHIGAYGDYERLRRQIDRPAARMLTTIFVATCVALAVSTGALSLNFGQKTTAGLPDDTALAVLVGFLAGYPTSVLAKRVQGFLRGRSDSVSSTRRQQG